MSEGLLSLSDFPELANSCLEKTKKPSTLSKTPAAIEEEEPSTGGLPAVASLGSALHVAQEGTSPGETSFRPRRQSQEGEQHAQRLMGRYGCLCEADSSEAGIISRKDFVLVEAMPTFV